MKRRLTSLLLAGALLITSALSWVSAANAANLVSNPSMETASAANPALPQDWDQDHWGKNTAAFSYASTGQSGSRSLRIDVSAYTSGDNKWYFKPVAVTPNTAYTYTEFYQSNVATPVVVQYLDAQGTASYVQLKSLTASTAWKSNSISFTTPANAVSVTMLHLIKKVGYLAIDNVSLSPAGGATPTPTVTVTPTASPTATPTASPTVSPSPSPSASPSSTPTASPTASPTATPSPTTSPSPTPVPVPGNLVPNPSLETASGAQPASWQSGGWGANTATYSYLTTGHSGGRSARVQITNFSNGDAKWFFAPQAVAAGIYRFSDYYQSTASTDVVAAIALGNGTTSYVYVGAAPASTAWRQFSGQFDVPAGAQTVTVYHLLGQNGTLTVDDYALVSDAVTITDNVPNASVEQVSPTNPALPANWQTGAWGTNTTVFSYMPVGHTGSRSIKVEMTQHTSGDAKWSYTPQPVTPGERYRVSDWYMANRDSQMVLALTMSNGSIQYLTLGYGSATPNWRQFQSYVWIPAGAVSATMLHLINGVGYLATDDYSMVLSSPVALNRPLVSLTFDDGWATQYTNGLPLLEQYHVPSTFYLVSGFLNQAGYLSTSQAAALKAAGNEIGSHTVSHPNLATQTPSQLTTQLQSSQDILLSLLGAPIDNFASPEGVYNDQVIAGIQQYYRSHRSTDVGYNAKDGFNAYNIRVQNIVATTTLAEVQAWLAMAAQQKTWLVLVYHTVDPSDAVGGEHNVTPAELATHLQAVNASGVVPVTINQALLEIQTQL
jgi:peptidoglycan/xylan/chitin deacetylase (PgdA/CDA1 family)